MVKAKAKNTYPAFVSLPCVWAGEKNPDYSAGDRRENLWLPDYLLHLNYYSYFQSGRSQSKTLHQERAPSVCCPILSETLHRNYQRQ